MMKTQKKRWLFAFLPILVLTLSNCNNDNDDLAPNGQMTAIVGGDFWEARDISAGAVQGQFSLSGVAADGSTISLRMNSFGEGTYNSSSGSSNALIWQPSTGALGYTSIAPMGFGQIVVDEVDAQDSLISGTFIFLGQEPSSGDTVTVAEGKFTEVRYLLEAVTVGDNFLKTKIDGTLWEASLVAAYTGDSKINLSATNADVTRTVGLSFPVDITEGNHEIGSPFSSAECGGTYLFNNISHTADSGTLTITHHDALNKVVEGTFQFEASEFLGSATASLTEGSFYLAY